MIQEKVAEILAEHVGCDVSTITGETKFEDLGIDSLEIAEIIMQLEDECSVEIELNGNIKQVSDLVAVISQKLDGK